MHTVIQGIDEGIEAIKSLNAKKLFLVVGSSFYRLPLKEKIDTVPAEKYFFSNFTPNPLYEQVVEGVRLFKEEKCDAIMAVGGGSAIDVAKCIKLALISKEGTDALIPPLVSTRVEVFEASNMPLIALPTTAGSGSESTHNAVIYYEDSKQTVINDAILPDVAILEHSVLINLPLYQKKCTMLDAFCQAIESWWSVNSTDESKEYSQKAVELVMANWESYIFNNDAKAMEQIMIAANYAGKAISIAQTTAAHAMSYKITSLYGLPHGHAVAICLPKIWMYMINNMGKCCDVRGTEYLTGVFRQIAQSMACSLPEDAINLFICIMDKLDLSTVQNQISNSDVESLVLSLNSVRLKNNPVIIDTSDVRSLYNSIILAY